MCSCRKKQEPRKILDIGYRKKFKYRVRQTSDSDSEDSEYDFYIPRAIFAHYDFRKYLSPKLNKLIQDWEFLRTNIKFIKTTQEDSQNPKLWDVKEEGDKGIIDLKMRQPATGLGLEVRFEKINNKK
jgi:hypothetical protein